MSEPNALMIHVGRKRAAPDHCPVCGAETNPEYPVGQTMADMVASLKIIYTHPSDVFALPVPGWNGFVSWYYRCYHESPMLRHLRDERNHLLGLLEKAAESKYIPIPLSVT